MSPALEVPAAFVTGLAVGALSALAGIGGGVLMVPFLYLVYAPTGITLAAQTVVAHATSLGVAFVTSTVGTWRYARTRSIDWRAAAFYSVPGVLSAFLVARLLTKADEAAWVRGAFGAFLLLSALDMARRAMRSPAAAAEAHQPSRLDLVALVGIGILGGGLSALLGIGGGLIAVPALLYFARLPIRMVAPTALAGVCLTTLSGGVSYLTAGTGPVVSRQMVGFVDLRMAVPLALGAVVTVPLGVLVNRRSSAPTLFWLFAAIFAAIGVSILLSWWRSQGG